MITVSMAIEDKALWTDAQSCLQAESIQMDFAQPQTGDLGVFMTNLARTRPDLVLMDVSTLRDPVPEVIQKIRAATPDSMIVALNTVATAGTVLECFRAGADEYLFPPFADGLHKALQLRAAGHHESENAKPGGKLMAFFTAKGGCGATTLACHVALELSRLEQRVLLADLDVKSGMVGFLMKSKSPYSIADALKNVHRLDANYWKALVSASAPGLEVISAPAMAVRHEVKPEEMAEVLKFARKQYQWTVADAGSGISPATMTILEVADEACLVTTAEIPALHQTRHILQKLLDCGYKQEHLRLILNRHPKRSGIKPAEIEEMLGLPLYAVFPECYSDLHEAYAQGSLLSSRTELGRDMGRLAGNLAGIQKLKAPRKIPFFR